MLFVSVSFRPLSAVAVSLTENVPGLSNTAIAPVLPDLRMLPTPFCTMVKLLLPRPSSAALAAVMRSPSTVYVEQSFAGTS